MQRLSVAEPGADTPADWAPWLDDMKAEAAKGAQATDLPAAAAAVAAVGATCGECHRTTRGGPEFTGDEMGYSHYGRTGLEETMARHLWSANELWLGLSGPVHPAWSRGAAALMNITVPKVVTQKGTTAEEDKPPTGEGALQTEQGAQPPEGSQASASAAPPKSAPDTVDLDKALHDLQALGARADKAGIPKEKQAVFADVIARCGSCHAYLGIEVATAQ
jgi:cytochrome c556